MVQLDLMTVTVKNSSPIKPDEAKLREAVVKHGGGRSSTTARARSIAEWAYVLKTIQT